MNSMEWIAPVVTAVGMASFATVFTVLYRSYATSAVAEYETGKCDVELIDETIISNLESTKASRRAGEILRQALFGIAVALLVPFLLISIYSKFVNGVAMFGGYGMIAVASGSMSEKNPANPYLATIDNQFNTYDMILLEKVTSPGDLQRYDVIAYVNDQGVNVIHRIVGFEHGADGLRIVTRGDSNNADDNYKPRMEDVLGKYADERIPYVGSVVMFLQSYSGIITVAAVLYCLIMIEGVRNKIERAREARLEILQESINFKTDTVQDDRLESSFVETVYFKNYAYTFDEKGFVSKTLIDESFHPETNKSASAEQASGGDDGEKL